MQSAKLMDMPQSRHSCLLKELKFFWVEKHRVESTEAKQKI